MRILILDDDQGRHDTFAIELADHSRLHVYNHADACAALNTEVFDLAMLDHDLSDFLPTNRAWGYCEGPTEQTGLDVARYIVSLPEDKRPKRVVVHSWNPEGAWKMVAELRKAGVWCRYRPFGGETPAGLKLIRDVAICLRQYAPEAGPL